ncbi:MAG: PA domain-containing protein [Burkholderiaceae bacterium]
MKNNLIAAALLGLVCALPVQAANLKLLNVDEAGVGFNDPAPATPVGGNSGTTVGQQRLIAYQKALELWGKTLRSKVDITVQGSFARLTCDAGSGVLAQAGATFIFSDFPNAPLPGHWYHSALADALSGSDLVEPDFGPGVPDIIANFNGAVGQQDCIAGPGWYYGLDNNAPAGQIDFLDTFMHEVAHGLGFSNFANELSGTTPAGLPDVYMANTLDLTFGLPWNSTVFGDETPLFIQFSARNTGNVVWSGPKVTAGGALVLGPYQGIRVTGTLNQELVFGTASFGPAPTAENFGGEIQVVNDGVGVGTDGCSSFTGMAGKIAFMDRGVCGFAVKAKNAQLAGAKGVIIGNNQPGGAIGLGGSDPTITIPTISVSQADGTAIKAASPGVSVEFFSDPTRKAGTNQGLVRLYAPATVALGSSISHFDTVAAPNLLMEPFINADLRSARNLDLTPALMQDIGWQMETLKIGTCDTGVPNYLANGDLLHVKLEACNGARNRGQFVSCTNGVTNPLVGSGLLTGAQKGAITSCAGRAN